jgi:hypothetical protein
MPGTVSSAACEERAMEESARFYWHRGEATLTLAAVPAEDRSPLRVRLGVLRAHAPAVIRQFEEGQFVAGAWRSGGQIYMIVCHPSYAKGSDDTICLNTAALPRVVIKLRDWEEGPEVARLLLTAFGSEAADEEECVSARRALIDWLTGHGQAEMAEVVKHFFSFPFGIRSDALDVVNIWRHVLVKGQREQIDRFLRDAQQRFEALGWSQDPASEGRMNRGEYRRNRFYCWISRPNIKPRVLLCLNRTTDRRVRGGTYDLLDERAGLSDLAAEIQLVLADVLEPAAAAAGLEVSYPRLGPISRVGPRTTAAMTALAEAGDGQWPLQESLEPVWRNFVLTAFRDDVALNPEELTEWFLASGWDEQASMELTKRLYTEAALLGEFEEAGRQPV